MKSAEEKGRDRKSGREKSEREKEKNVLCFLYGKLNRFYVKGRV